MSYKNYISARDAAWRVLIECHVQALPVKLSRICKHYGWKLADYRGGQRIIDALGLAELQSQTDGFCTMTRNHTYIFFDSSLPIGRQRFTIAHEIGHIVLGHIALGAATTDNREPTGYERAEERQANQFAARLLAPACVLHELGAVTLERIQQLCGLSAAAAATRAERMQELERRGKYYVSPVERQVLEQFRSYIFKVRGL